MTAAPLTRRLRPSATDRAFRALIAQAGQDVRALVDRLVSGELDTSAWAGAMEETLAHAHAEAGYRGRLRAGDLAPFDRDDERFGALVAQEESAYLWRFRQDLEADKFGIDEPETEKIQRRALLYVARLYGTANEALALAAGGDEEWVWVLGETDATCTDCMRLATGSPYRAGALPTYPRSGTTRCLGNCKCEIRTASGLHGFAP